MSPIILTCVVSLQFCSHPSELLNTSILLLPLFPSGTHLLQFCFQNYIMLFINLNVNHYQEQCATVDTGKTQHIMGICKYTVKLTK